MEFYKLLEGYEARARREHITVEDLMKHIYPPTELERMKEEIEFKREWIESGGGEIE